MSYKDSEMVAFILKAAIDGITQSYLAGKNEKHAAIKGHLEILVQDRLLAEFADRSRNYVAYKTTQKGLEYLLAYSAIPAVEA
jgi:hypothetical protein